MAIRDYSSIYSIEEWLVNIVAPEFYDMSNVSLLNVGQFGMTNHVIGTVIEDQFAVVDRYINEMLPQKANLPEFIYANAALYGIEDLLARASKSSMLLYIKEKDILDKGVYRSTGSTITTGGNVSYVTYKDFVIDSDMFIMLDDVQYSIPYDVNIQVSEIERAGVKEHSYIATWMMDVKNSIADITTPYIKLYRAAYDGDIWIVLKLDIYQYCRTPHVNPILTNSKLNIPYFEVRYSDQLCNFEVFYQEPGTDTWIQLEKRLDSSIPVSTPFVYYKIVDDNTIRFSFANDDRYFVPDYNSTIKVYTYETTGKSGDFKMVDEEGYTPSVSLSTEDENRAYNRSVTVIALIGADGIGGRTKLSVQEIKSLTCEKVLTIDSITTENDLTMWAKEYASVYETNPVFIKYRDDPAGREYGCFIRLGDGVDIFPSNTLNLKISTDEADSYYPSLRQYTFRPGKRYVYDDDKETSSAVIYDEDKHGPVDELDISYTSIFLMVIRSKPNEVKYYLNTVDKSVSLEYTYINNFSYYTFLANSCTITRNAIEGEDRYHVHLEIMRVDGVIEGIHIDDVAQDSTKLHERLKVLIAFDTNEGHYVEMELVDKNVHYGTYIFETYLETDDIIDDSRISITNLKNNETGEVQSRIVYMSNPVVHFCVFCDYGEGNNISHKYEKISGVSDYTLCNEYSPYEGEFYFALPMNLTRSHVLFIEDSSSSLGFGFIVKQSPLFGYDFIKEDSNNVAQVTNGIANFHKFITDTLMRVTPNFTINIKFFNTYGRSKMFYVSEKELLDYVNLKILMKVKFFAGVDVDTYVGQLRTYIKDFIENLNVIKEGNNKFEVSVLIHKIHEEFSEQVEYVIFDRLNGYPPGIWTVELNGLLPSETTPDTVPEYMTLKKSDIILIPV